MRLIPWLLAVPLAAVALGAALAGDPPKPPADKPPADKPKDEPKQEPKEKAEPDYKGPEIRWALSFTDAVEEAAQRNALIYRHSHGST